MTLNCDFYFDGYDVNYSFRKFSPYKVSEAVQSNKLIDVQAIMRVEILPMPVYDMTNTHKYYA